MIQSLKNKLLWCSIILVSLLFVSSVTAVPQTQGSLVVEQIDEIQSQKQLYTVLEALQQPDISEDDFAAVLASLPSEISTHVSSRLETLLTSDIVPLDTSLLDILKALLSNLLTMLFDESLWELFNPGGNSGGGGLLEQLVQALMLLLTIPILIIKALAKGVVVLAQGLIRVLGALIAIIVFIFSGVQTFLTLTGLVILFIGIMSKIGFQFFAALGAPIFALLAIFTSLSFGKMLGGLSMIFSSVAAAAVIFAIPLLIILLLPLIIEPPEFEFNLGDNLFKEGGLLYMLASVFANIFSISSS